MSDESELKSWSCKVYSNQGTSYNEVSHCWSSEVRELLRDAATHRVGRSFYDGNAECMFTVNDKYQKTCECSVINDFWGIYHFTTYYLTKKERSGDAK